MGVHDLNAWSKETNTVLTINSEPLDPDKIYKCAVLYLVAMKGIDGVTPLADQEPS